MGDGGFDFEVVSVVVAVLEVVAFDLPRVVGDLWLGVAVLVDAGFDLVLLFGVAVDSVF